MPAGRAPRGPGPERRPGSRRRGARRRRTGGGTWRSRQPASAPSAYAALHGPPEPLRGPARPSVETFEGQTGTFASCREVCPLALNEAAFLGGGGLSMRPFATLAAVAL